MQAIQHLPAPISLVVLRQQLLDLTLAVPGSNVHQPLNQGIARERERGRVQLTVLQQQKSSQQQQQQQRKQFVSIIRYATVLTSL